MLTLDHEALVVGWPWTDVACGCTKTPTGRTRTEDGSMQHAARRDRSITGMAMGQNRIHILSFVRQDGPAIRSDQGIPWRFWSR